MNDTEDPRPDSEEAFREGDAPEQDAREDGTAFPENGEDEERQPGGEASLSTEELADLEKKAGERDLYLRELLRAKADLDNYQKRVRKERVNWEERAVSDLLRKLLTVVDDFDRAEEAMDHAGASLESLAHGVKLTKQAFLKALADDGVEEISALGETFDPTVHEAVMEEEVSDKPTGEVVGVVQKGYRRKNTVLRPSKVRVARNVAS